MSDYPPTSCTECSAPCGILRLNQVASKVFLCQVCFDTFVKKWTYSLTIDQMKAIQDCMADEQNDRLVFTDTRPLAQLLFDAPLPGGPR